MAKLTSSFAKDLDWLEGFYAQVGYGGGLQPLDRVFFSKGEKGIAGVVRLATESGVKVLRGMQVSEAHRGKGVGAALLKYLVEELGDTPCFCLPYTHLEAFYGAEGFRIANDRELPQFLVERKHGYLNRGMDVLAMVRQPAELVL